jgi:hypothetical protein
MTMARIEVVRQTEERGARSHQKVTSQAGTIVAPTSDAEALFEKFSADMRNVETIIALRNILRKFKNYVTPERTGMSVAY